MGVGEEHKLKDIFCFSSTFHASLKASIEISQDYLSHLSLQSIRVDTFRNRLKYLGSFEVTIESSKGPDLYLESCVDRKLFFLWYEVSQDSFISIVVKVLSSSK